MKTYRTCWFIFTVLTILVIVGYTNSQKKNQMGNEVDWVHEFLPQIERILEELPTATGSFQVYRKNTIGRYEVSLYKSRSVEANKNYTLEIVKHQNGEAKEAAVLFSGNKFTQKTDIYGDKFIKGEVKTVLTKFFD